MAGSLGPLEQRAMEHLWREGPSTVAEMLQALNSGSSRRLAYTTVMTILVRLHDKGYVSRSREGRHFRYGPDFDRESLTAELGRRELRSLIERHGAASLAGFAADLAGSGSDLAARLRDLADSEERKS